MQWSSPSMERALGEARAAFESGQTRSYEWRSAQLGGLLRLVQDKEDDIFEALGKDLGKHHVEAFKDEVGAIIKSVNMARQSLKSWMADEKVYVPLIGQPATARILSEPLGLVLIFSCWNFPIGLSLEPLIGAIAAGNCVVLKPSEVASATSNFLAINIPQYMDDKAVKVIQGSSQVSERLLEFKWDKIFFTGGPRVGRIVMTAAVKHLTPVVLELGGKCPAVVDSLTSPHDQQVAANRLVAGKWGSCAGQACIAIDYMLVEEKFAPTLISLLKSTLKKFFTKSEYMACIVNEHHFKRLTSLLKDQAIGSCVVHGGSSDHVKLSIEPTILLNPPLDSQIMTEEIFGPLLPIITLKNIDDSIEFIRARPKPLAIYAFTNDGSLKRRIINKTSSGSITINDALVQYMLDGVPFGGVGQSGFGQYHSKFSFDMFSHKKPVMRRSFLIEFDVRYPPWDEWKLAALRYLYRFNYFGFLLVFSGLKRR